MSIDYCVLFLVFTASLTLFNAILLVVENFLLPFGIASTACCLHVAVIIPNKIIGNNVIKLILINI